MSNAYDPSGYPQAAPMGGAPGADGGQAVAPYSAQSPYASAASGAQPGYQQPGYQQPGFDQAGYQQPGYQQPGYQQDPGFDPNQMGYQQPVAYYDQKSKLAAGLFGIFFGSLGVHNFYLGYTNKAVGQLVGTIVGYILCIIFIGFFIVVGIQSWALVEGILILSAQPGSQPWGVDARGVPLSSN